MLYYYREISNVFIYYKFLDDVHSVISDSQGISIFLRESSVADEIIPSGVPIGADKFHQEDYIGAAQHGATKVSVLTEKSVLSMTSTLNNPGEAQVLLSDSST